MEKFFAQRYLRLAYFCAIALVLSTLGPITVTRASEVDCGPLKNYNDFGPFDYNDPENRVATGADPMGRIKRVENVHFQDEMKALNLKQFSVERLTGEFVYTLRAFPNHPEALYAMSRLEKLAGGKLPQKAITPFTPKITADCFFDRAVRFRPEDAQVHFILAIHLHDRGRLAEAKEEYSTAEKLGLITANLYYNYGLLLTDLKEWGAALDYARKAYDGGFALDGLRRRLAAAGHPL